MRPKFVPLYLGLFAFLALLVVLFTDRSVGAWTLAALATVGVAVGDTVRLRTFQRKQATR